MQAHTTALRSTVKLGRREIGPIGTCGGLGGVHDARTGRLEHDRSMCPESIQLPAEFAA